MKKRIASTLSLFILGLAFIGLAYFVGKTIEENKPSLQPVLDELQKKIEEETEEPNEDIRGEQTENKLTVTRIIDGDTLVISSGETVRLIGVDAPEKKDCLSTKAANRLSELVLNKEIIVEYDKEAKDRYGRTLLYIWINDIFVNELLAREGLADSKRYPPNIKSATILEAAEEQAKSAKLGIWSDNPCISAFYFERSDKQGSAKPVLIARTKVRYYEEVTFSLPSNHFSQSIAAWQPNPAAVTACL